LRPRATHSARFALETQTVTVPTTNVIVHVAAGAVGLALGLMPLLTLKGGYHHRIWGRWFVGLAAITVATACIGVLAGAAPSALAAVTLSAGYQFTGSLRALALKNRAPGVIDGLLAVAALILICVLLATMGPGTPSWSPAIGYSTLAYVGMVALYDLSRHTWPRTWTRVARPLDHGLKMTGVYFAMASAGAGNLLRDLQPWSQILPSALGVSAMLALSVAYFVKLRRQQAVPL
jgi:uncharacterized membrane protein